MNIRKLVKSRLKSIGKSQYWLAGEIGISKQGLNAYLRGKNDMNASTLGRALDVLGLEIRRKR